LYGRRARRDGILVRFRGLPDRNAGTCTTCYHLHAAPATFPSTYKRRACYLRRLTRTATLPLPPCATACDHHHRRAAFVTALRIAVAAGADRTMTFVFILPYALPAPHCLSSVLWWNRRDHSPHAPAPPSRRFPSTFPRWHCKRATNTNARWQDEQTSPA